MQRSILLPPPLTSRHVVRRRWWMYLMEIVAVILLGLLIGSLITAAVHTGADAVSFARKILLPYAEQQISSNLKHIEL
jgi:hypothetical protein